VLAHARRCFDFSAGSDDDFRRSVQRLLRLTSCEVDHPLAYIIEGVGLEFFSFVTQLLLRLDSFLVHFVYNCFKVSDVRHPRIPITKLFIVLFIHTPANLINCPLYDTTARGRNVCFDR
jgi:hypothetical protein